MHNLLDFLRKYAYLLLFVVLEGVSLLLLLRHNSYQGCVWLSSANAVVARVNGLYDGAMAYLRLRNVNRQLTDENVRLWRETALLRDALAQATHDSTLTERYVQASMEGYSLLPATVVSNGTETAAGRYLVVNRGERDGVRPEMGVVGGGGVVGIVYLTGPHHSLVIPVTNRKSSISCRIRGSRYFGYLVWRGEGTLTARLGDIPRYAKIKQGDYVETSGYSSVFPPGIFVGRISHLGTSADGQTYDVVVNLGTDFANLRDVSIVTTPYKAETDSLRSHAAEADAAFDEAG